MATERRAQRQGAVPSSMEAGHGTRHRLRGPNDSHQPGDASCAGGGLYGGRACRRPWRGPRREGVRVVMNTVRVDKPWVRESAELARIAKRPGISERPGIAERPRIEIPPAMIVIASACAVFACFFAIGRATHAGGASDVESLPVASTSASVPLALTSAPPLAVASVEAGGGQAPGNSQPSSAVTGSSSAQSVASDPSQAPTSSSVYSPAPASPPTPQTYQPPAHVQQASPSVSSQPAAPAAPSGGSSG